MDNCPYCGGALLDVQGGEKCTVCGWFRSDEGWEEYSPEDIREALDERGLK